MKNYNKFFIIAITFAITFSIVLFKLGDRNWVAKNYPSQFTELCKSGFYKYNQYQPTQNECQKLLKSESEIYGRKAEKASCLYYCEDFIIKDKCDNQFLASGANVKLLNYGLSTSREIRDILGSDCFIDI